MENAGSAKSETWRTVGGDLADDEWELITDLVAPYWKPGEMGRPVKHDRRAIVNAIFYVTATGCQWRRLPGEYPNWSTVHHSHVTWSRDGTWERVCVTVCAPWSANPKVATAIRRVRSSMPAVSARHRQ